MSNDKFGIEVAWPEEQNLELQAQSSEEATEWVGVINGFIQERAAAAARQKAEEEGGMFGGGDDY